MQLDSDTRELLLAVDAAKEERWWERLETMLGLRWDIDTLVGAGTEEKTDPNQKPKPVQLPRHVQIPLLVALAPEFFKHLSEEMARKYRTLMETRHKSGGDQVIEIGNLSARDARELFKAIGAQVASAQPPGD